MNQPALYHFALKIGSMLRTISTSEKGDEVVRMWGQIHGLNKGNLGRDPTTLFLRGWGSLRCPRADAKQRLGSVPLDNLIAVL